MKLSVVIPVFNERQSILEVLRRVEAVHLENIEKELVIVDDCSTDGTRAKGERRPFPLADSGGVLHLTKCKILFQEKNRGKGARFPRLSRTIYVRTPCLL